MRVCKNDGALVGNLFYEPFRQLSTRSWSLGFITTERSLRGIAVFSEIGAPSPRFRDGGRRGKKVGLGCSFLSIYFFHEIWGKTSLFFTFRWLLDFNFKLLSVVFSLVSEPTVTPLVLEEGESGLGWQLLLLHPPADAHGFHCSSTLASPW